MTRIKVRYVVAKFLFENNRKTSLESVLISIIRSRLLMDYGIHISSITGRLSVVEHFPHCGIAIVRCDAEICKHILFTMSTVGEISGVKCSISVLWVSGILKKAMIKASMFARNENTSDEVN